MKDRKILALILVIVLVMSSFTFAFGESPGLKLTTASGNEVQKNSFDTKMDVYLYGSNITNDLNVTYYYLKVTDPSGSNNLGTTTTPSLVVSGGSIYPNPTNIWDLVEFSDTSNNGGQYKVWIATDADFTQNVHNTKTFSVKNSVVYGSITFSKDVRNVINDSTPFQVMISGPDGYSNTIDVVEGTPVTVPSLYFGEYNFYEVVPQGYIGITTQGSLNINSNNLSPSFTFVNDKINYAIDVTKVANPPSANVGDVITYSIKVTNNSNVQLTDIVVVDSMFILETDPITLAAGAYKDYTVTASAVLGTMNNTVTASSIIGNVSDSASASVIVSARPNHGLSITKSANPTSAAIGTQITYTIVVTNTGTANLSNVLVEDVNLDFTTSVAINVGQYETFTLYETYNTTGQKVNVASASVPGLVDSVTAQAIVNIFDDVQPTYGSIRIDKSVNGNQSNQNDVFTFVISQGEWSRTVTASAIQDGIALDLEPGTYIVTEQNPSPYTLQTANNVPVEVTTGNESLVQFTNRYNISSPPPSTTYSMSITKTANETEVSVGDLITYTITVTNTGNGTLTNISVIDDMVDLDEVIATLAVGASQSFEVTYLTTEIGLLENTATATSTQTSEVEDVALVFVIEVPLGVPEVEEEVEVVEVPEEEVPLAIPDTGTDASVFAYGAGAMLSLLGLLKKKRR
jgi:LPXTG-motif cell wall-anchored protein